MSTKFSPAIESIKIPGIPLDILYSIHYHIEQMDHLTKNPFHLTKSISYYLNQEGGIFRYNVKSGKWLHVPATICYVPNNERGIKILDRIRKSAPYIKWKETTFANGKIRLLYKSK
jgi:hypothetical protein